MRDDTRPQLANRQMTIGECIALERYGTTELDERPMSIGQILTLIDRLEVCTTCGWSRHMHDHSLENPQVIGLCAHYERQL